MLVTLAMDSCEGKKERIKVITAIIKEIISITCSYDNFSLVETDTGSCMGKLLFSQIEEKSATVF